MKAIQKRIEITRMPKAGDPQFRRRASMLDDGVVDTKHPCTRCLAATGCVLLIACMNVASLLVARTAARRRELAIRTALGGGRMRLHARANHRKPAALHGRRRLGPAVRLGRGRWLVHARPDMNRVGAVHIDGVVVAFALGAIALCTLFAGLVSAVGSAGKQILATLQESSRAQSPGRAKAGLRRTLLVIEVGLTVVLLVGAGLLLKSYQRLRNADIGVPVDNVLTMRISLPEARYRKPEQWVAFFENLIAQVRALPGVEAAGLVSKAPGEG